MRFASAALFVALLFVVLALVVTMRDSPVNYSEATAPLLIERIGAHETAIERHGEIAVALDADRYWPHDLDRTVLSILLFEEQYERWPKHWRELIESGLVADPSCIHENWKLHLVESGWEIALTRWGTIALYEKQ